MQGRKELQKLVRKWAALWGVPSLAGVEIITNVRLRTSLGRCFPRMDRIELNPSLFKKGRALLKEVLCHEAAHIASYALYRLHSRPHSHQWALLMNTAGFTPKATISLRKCVPSKGCSKINREVFEHYCPVCRFTRTARKPVPQWKCRTCISAGFSGTLKIRSRPIRRAAAV
jgi:predicted SprT family Zn-dependent metalloprotease